MMPINANLPKPMPGALTGFLTPPPETVPRSKFFPTPPAKRICSFARAASALRVIRKAEPALKSVCWFWRAKRKFPLLASLTVIGMATLKKIILTAIINSSVMISDQPRWL